MSDTPFKIFITRRIPEEGLQILQKDPNLKIQINPHNRILKHAELLNFVKGYSGILCLLTDKINAQIMEAAGNKLKVISNCAVGYDNIDLKEAQKRKIVVTNTPGVLTESTADFTWALLLGIARRIAEANAFTRSGKFQGWDPLLLLGRDVYGKKLGIIGFGRIGHAVAKRAFGFNMKILAYTRSQPRDDINAAIQFVPLKTLLKESDFITLHTPLTSETRHMIGQKELRLMKTSAYLINTSRGPVVDEAALVKALKEKQIAGAALDVYEQEPKVHRLLLTLPNVLPAPHIASASVETRAKMAMMAAQNLLAVLRGKEPVYRVI